MWFCRTAKPGVKTTCMGFTRWRLSKLMKECKPLTCRICRGEEARTREVENEGVTPGRCGAATCKTKAKIRKGSPFLICSSCESHFHVQRKCSEMTAAQRGVLDKSTWECPNCMDRAAARMAEAVHEEEETRYQQTKANGRTIRILQLNVDSLLSKLDDLKGFIEKEDIDVFVIQETKLIRKDRLPKIPGFAIERQDRQQPKGKEGNRGGGLITGVSLKLGKKRLPKFGIKGTRDHLTEWLTIEIPTSNGEKIRVTNVYIPPANSEASRNQEQAANGGGANNGRENRQGALYSNNFDVRRWPCKDYDVILGDTNAHSQLWDTNWTGDEADERGNIIENWCAANNMAPLNNGEATRKCRTSGKGTAPDQAFVHASKLDRFTWEVAEGLSSDHVPIIITYQDMFPTINDNPIYKWNLKNAEWEKYSELVERNIPTRYARKGLDKVEGILRKAMIKAAKKHIKKKKITSKVKSYLTTEVKEAITRRNALSKSMGENRRQWRDACKETAEMIRVEKEKCWKEYVAELDRTSDTRKIFRTVRGIDGQAQSQQHKNEVLEVDGVSYIADKDKADQFAKTYRKFSKLPSRKKDRVVKKGVREARRLARGSGALQECEQDITAEEVLRVIKQAKNNKAAGMDDIPYEMMKHLGPRAMEMLVHIYRRCWKGEGIPRKWRDALIKPLLKEGKDAKETTSYRPISLTSCMGKVLEKVIANRLIYVLEDRKLLNENQAGFRPARSTTDQVWKLVQDASDNMHEESRKRTVATFFDYEKAYDKVWRDGLLMKMGELGIPQRFTTYVRHFLSNRRTQVEVNNTKSSEFILREGLPQGSSISPLLFLIFINDLPVDLDLKTAASLFADDTATWRRDGTVRGSDRKLIQEEVNKITQWADDWKMKVNASKTKVMVISTAKADREWDPELEACGAGIGLVQDYPFLGVTVPSNLCFASHVDKVVERCRKRNRVLKCVGTKSWGCSLEAQRMIYVQFIRPSLEYGSPAWGPWSSVSSIQKLQRVQNEALRSIAGLTATCPVDFLHLETGIEPLQDRFAKNNRLMRERYMRMPDDDSRKVLMEKQARVRLKTRKGLRHATDEYPGEANFARAVSRPCLPPWRRTKITFDKVPLDKKKSEYSTEELRTRTEEKIKELEAEAVIYTDGSTSGRQENGGAGMYAQNRRDGTEERLCWPAGRYCASYGAECVAFLKAIEWAEGNELTSIAICTDSLSLQQALESDSWRDAEDWIGDIKEALFKWDGRVTIMWIPSHCGVDGNEVADKLADEGAKLPQEGIPVTHATAKARIRRTQWSLGHTRAEETYGERRCPKYQVERRWPRNMRSLYARLRTGHAKQLREYLYKIDAEDDPYCDCGLMEEQTIKHLLCDCPQLARARAMESQEQVTMQHMTTDPEMCRRILAVKFTELKKTHTQLAEEAQDVGRVGPQSAPCAPLRAV